MLHMYDDIMHQPSERLMTKHFFTTLLFSTSTPSMMNMEVVTVSAFPCIFAMVRALMHSCKAGPNIKCAALTNKECQHLCGGCLLIDEQLEVHTVLLPLSFAMALMNRVGSKKGDKVFTETELLNLLAIHSFFAPPRQNVLP
jgi:hypothetical protein